MDERTGVAQQFARNFARCRRRAGLSQEEVGFSADLHRTEIGMLERGVRVPRIDTAAKLAAALGVEVAELMEGIVWRAPVLSAGGFDRPGDESGSPDGP
jgi:transcriptional regulator with XRE-family HTH domain